MKAYPIGTRLVFRDWDKDGKEINAYGVVSSDADLVTHLMLWVPSANNGQGNNVAVAKTNIKAEAA